MTLITLHVENQTHVHRAFLTENGLKE